MKNPDLFSSLAAEDILKNAPLAARCRPRSIADFLGQEAALANGKPLRRWLESGNLPSMILTGPPGCGKTSFARLLGEQSGYRLEEMIATEHGVSDFKKLFEAAKSGLFQAKEKILLFVDEVHRLSKTQQDVLLKGVEEGLVTFVGVTTENPQHSINSALLSRTHVVKFSGLSNAAIIEILERGLSRTQLSQEVELKDLHAVINKIAAASEGDARRALNILDSILKSDERILLSLDALEAFLKDVGGSIRSMSDDLHYNLASVYIKAMRAGDEALAIQTVLKLLSHGEDPVFLARRLVIFSAEDVGLASPQLLTYVESVFSAVQKIGMPEARYLIVAATMASARAKKSREVAEKIMQAEETLQ